MSVRSSTFLFSFGETYKIYAVTRFEPKPASGSRYIQCQSCSIGHFQNISPLPLPAAELNTDYELQPHGAPLDLGPIFAPGAF